MVFYSYLGLKKRELIIVLWNLGIYMSYALHIKFGILDDRSFRALVLSMKVYLLQIHLYK